MFMLLLLFEEFDWLTYATLLPALPHHAVLPLLDCDTLEELDCELVMLWLPTLKLKLPPQTASSSLSVNSRIVCHSLLGLRIAAQSISANKALPLPGNASSQP